jgi:hypothetical protein
MGKLARWHFDHLRVWSKGNAFFNGAKAWEHEENFLLDDTNKVFVELEEKDGVYTLKTNVYDFLGDFRAGMVTSDILGCAFEPEQRFENNDGSAIVFDRDYNGEHRGMEVLPGAFAHSAEETLVW